MNIFENDPGIILNDTVCCKPAIFFNDSTCLNAMSRWDHSYSFPFLFIEKNRQHEKVLKTSLTQNLKEGEPLPSKLFHYDWIIIIVLISAFFYASLPAYSRKLFPGATRFFMFRGIGEAESRETTELFRWQSTIFNLVTFVNIALFILYADIFHGAYPGSLPAIYILLAALALVIIVITLRHIICLITGRLSGEKDVFDEYIITIYQSYRYIAFGLLILVSLISYTEFLTPKVFFISGYILFSILYLMRIARLFLIFLKKKLSLFYWILYLCALEILPAGILIKSAARLF